jgi:hypothetical protein
MPLAISSDSESDSESNMVSDQGSDGEPHRSGCVKKNSRVVESQQWQVDNGLIPAPGASAKARALNAKRKKE